MFDDILKDVKNFLNDPKTRKILADIEKEENELICNQAELIANKVGFNGNK